MRFQTSLRLLVSCPCFCGVHLILSTLHKIPALQVQPTFLGSSQRSAGRQPIKNTRHGLCFLIKSLFRARARMRALFLASHTGIRSPREYPASCCLSARQNVSGIPFPHSRFFSLALSHIYVHVQNVMWIDTSTHQYAFSSALNFSVGPRPNAGERRKDVCEMLPASSDTVFRRSSSRTAFTRSTTSRQHFGECA